MPPIPLNFRPFPSISLHVSLISIAVLSFYTAMFVDVHRCSFMFHRISYVVHRCSLISIDVCRCLSIIIDFHCFFIDFRARMSEGVKGVKTVKGLKTPNGFPPLEPPSTFTYRIFISYRTLPQRFAPAGSHTPERGWRIIFGSS